MRTPIDHKYFKTKMSRGKNESSFQHVLLRFVHPKKIRTSHINAPAPRTPKLARHRGEEESSLPTHTDGSPRIQAAARETENKQDKKKIYKINWYFHLPENS